MNAFDMEQDHLFFYEPSLVDLAWIGFDHVPLGSDYNNRSVLSYHIYCGDVDSVRPCFIFVVVEIFFDK